MTDSAEMGERPADPATRGGVGVGAGPDDYADGMAEEQMEHLRETAAQAQKDGTQQDGTQQDGTQQDGTQQDGTQKDETEQ
ncbi:MAG TPA: hypothetical protein VLR26_07345, partial [Frankiaceae bacterium]|nr:hypothetical protein [Frankiaceae bacterium]